MKIFHEAPNSIFEDVQKLTDGDYALVHLLEENKQYLEHFKNSKKQGREIILDNSIFELGQAFDADNFVKWVEEIQPSWYIVPDVLEEAEDTVESFQGFISKHPKLPGKRVGVVQGKSYDDIEYCYSCIEPFCDMVAISFDYSFFETEYPHENKFISWAVGRALLLNRMSDYVNDYKPHHLLGVGIPQEGHMYRDKYKWLYSIDTSNPTVHGLKGIIYNDVLGLERKETQKLCTLIDADVNHRQLCDIQYNIRKFREIWNS